MSKLDLARFALSTGIHSMAALGFAVAVYLETTRRSSVANIWYLVFGSALIAGLQYNSAHLQTGDANAPLLFASLDVRTALAAAIWPVALWAAAERLGRFHAIARRAGWLIAALIGAVALKSGRAGLLEVLAGFGSGALISWQIVRMTMDKPQAPPASNPS